MNEIKEAAKEGQAAAALNESPVEASADTTPASRVAKPGPAGNGRQERLKVSELEEDLESKTPEPQREDQTSRQFAIVTSEPDPNQRELFDPTDEEEPCAA
jgi:hypothetical protein